MACRTKKKKQSIGLAEKGSINLDPKNKGTFTKFCKSKGHEGVTGECIEEGLASRNTKTRQRAQFAKNAKSFKH